MAYLTATRYGLTHIDLRKYGERGEQLHASGWRQVWEHPSGMLAMRQPWPDGKWVVSERGENGLWGVRDGWSSSLRAAALSIERRLREST